MKTLLMSLALGLIFTAQAELPPFVYDEMKRNAEDVVVVQILKAPKADAKLIGKRQQLTYEVKVLRVIRSKSRLRPSATITIQSSYYTFGPGEVGPSNPRRLKKNDVVTAYLNKGKKAGEFQIAAGGHSFEKPAAGADKDKPLPKDFKTLKALAEKGDARAQSNLGVKYVVGEGVKKDFEAAVKWFRKAAEQGHAGGQRHLGLMYRVGIGVEKDFKEALKWNRKSAEQGYAKGQTALGNMYFNGAGVEKDDKEAVKWYRKAAGQNYAEAQSNLGSMYKLGLGVEKDEKEAVEWFRKAALQGDASAQYNLGVAYAIGMGVPQDFREAEKWLRKAAEQGLAGAQLALGLSYINGIGVEQDFIAAYAWFSIADANGDTDAKEKKPIIAKTMTAEDIAKAEELSKEMVKKNPKLLNKKD